MTHVPYLVAGYGITFAVLGAYTGWVLVRSRRMRPARPRRAEPDQRWP